MDYQIKVALLKKSLSSVEPESRNGLNAINQAIILCRNQLLEFKTLVIKTGFSSPAEEVLFFKYTKQYSLLNLIYYFEIKSFEIQFPKGDMELQKRYILKKLGKVNKFFLRNLDFSQYVQQGKSYLDDRYFTRTHFNDFNVTNSKYYFRDPDFSTSHDLLLAKVNAYNKFIDYLETRLSNLGKPKNHNKDKDFKLLNWTGSKTDLTELGYALKFHGSVNNGNSSVNEIIKQLEQVFNFSSGDPYKNYSEMRLRKKSRTKFLDELAVGLQTKMGNDDR